mgnify:CR=1 FL=1
MTDASDTGFDRRTVLRSLGAGAVATTAATAATTPATADDAETEHYHNPVGPIGFGDVTAIQDEDGTYYVYGTETPRDIIPIARGDSLHEMEYIGQALESVPEWHQSDDAGVWAPDINYYDGEYRIYYSLSVWGSENAGIGLATSDTPEGPFEDQGPVLESDDLYVTNTIDADFNVVDGTPYLIWGSWNGINCVELNEAGDDYVEDTEFEVAGNLREGPYMIRENGYYYLFVSTGRCCEGFDSTYGVEVGRAEEFTGPYLTPDGTDLTHLDRHHNGYAVMSATNQFIGPGHNSAIKDDQGDWWMLYHVEGHAGQDQAIRTMMLDRIQWTDDDWPVVACNGHPSESSPVPGAEFSCDDPAFETSLQQFETATPTQTPTATATETATRTPTATGTATDAATPTTDGGDGGGGGVPGMGVLPALAGAGAAAAAALRRARDGEE